MLEVTPNYYNNLQNFTNSLLTLVDLRWYVDNGSRCFTFNTVHMRSPRMYSVGL